MADELTDEQVQQLVSDLRALQLELGAALEQSREGVKPVELDQPIGRLSRMDAIQQQNMLAATRRNTELRVRKIRAALAAAERGEYGNCVECEEPIGFRRLRARPESRLCLHCQRALEQPSR